MKKKSGIVLALILVMCVLCGCFDDTSDSNVSVTTGSLTEATTESEVTSAGNDYAYDPSKEGVIEEDNGIRYVSNILIVYFKSGVSEADKNAVVDEVNGVIVGRIDTLNQLQIKISARSHYDLMNLCTQVEANENVVIADIDEVYDSDVEPYFPADGYSDAWGEYPAGDNWGLEAIGAPNAWGYKDMMSQINVGVVDSGFDVNHRDLAGRLDAISSSGSPSVAPGHGTAVSGVIGAVFNNGDGISGVAPNAHINGYSVSSDSVPSSTLIAYVVQAIKDGNRIVNLSFGQSGNLNDCHSGADMYREGMVASLQISTLLSQGYDFLIVQSAGNGAKDHYGVDSVYNGLFASITPTNCYMDLYSYEEIRNHVIVVGAVALSGMEYYMDYYSNFGSNVDVCAPGTDILCLKAGGGCEYMNGTSFSAPYVSGTAAVIWGINPQLHAADVKRIICESGVTMVCPNEDAPVATGVYPLINAGNAADAAFNCSASTGDYSPDDFAFRNFLQQGYDDADDYIDGLAVFYDRDGNGQINTNGGTTWMQYCLADFDNDGANELLLRTTFYSAGTYSVNDMGLLRMYENMDGQVIEKNNCFMDGRGDLNSPDITLYNNGVVYWKDNYNGYNSINVFPFTDEIRNIIGIDESKYLSYSLLNDGSGLVSRYVNAGFFVDEYHDITESEYQAELNSILTGQVINPTVYPVTTAGIDEGFTE